MKNPNAVSSLYICKYITYIAILLVENNTKVELNLDEKYHCAARLASFENRVNAEGCLCRRSPAANTVNGPRCCGE